MNLLNDIPVGEPGLDTLGWTPYAEQVASILKGVDTGDSSYVVSIVGQWGSGKTSLLNLINYALKDGAGDSIAVAHFNPWNYSDSNVMLRAFFSLIKKEFDDNTDLGKAIGRALSKYAALLLDAIGSAIELLSSGLSITDPKVSIVLKPISWIAKKWVAYIASKQEGVTENACLEDAKNELDKCLLKATKKLIVFIDDLDRLSSDEIRLVFKLVALTCSFPNVVYVLSFDRSVVTRALDSVQGVDGNQYLEKIVQLSIPVPALGRDAVKATINGWYESLYWDTGYEKAVQSRARDHRIAGSLLPLFKTPRQIIRFHNVLYTNKLKMHYELCPADLLGMTALQVFVPKLFDWLHLNPSYFVGMHDSEHQIDSESMLKMDSEYRALLEECGDAEHHLDSMLKVLFPKVGKLNVLNANSASCRISYIEGRICSPDLFRMFNGYQVKCGLNRAELMDVLCNAEGERLKELLCYEQKNGDLSSFVRMISEVPIHLSPKRACVLTGALSKYLGKDRDASHGLNGPLSFDAEYSDMLCRLCDRFDASAIVGTLIDSLDGLDDENAWGLSDFIRDEANRRVGDGGDSDNPVSSDEQFEVIKDWFDSVMKAGATKALFAGDIIPLLAWKTVKPNSYRKFEDSLLSDRNLAVLFEACRLSKWLLNASDGFNFQDIESGEAQVELGEVENLMNDASFKSLSYEAQLRVGALFLLIRKGNNRSIKTGVSVREAHDFIATYRAK